MRTPLRFVVALFAASLFLTACDTNDDDDISGVYTATVFTADIEGLDVDVLAAGGDLSVRLREDLTFTANLTVPEVLSEGEDVPSSISGTYLVDGTDITFASDDDTFIRDSEWTLMDGELRTTSFGFNVILERN